MSHFIIIWRGLLFLLLSGCGFSYCDLYPAGNSHAGPKCLNCYKSWNGSWYDKQTDKTCTQPEGWPSKAGE